MSSQFGAKDITGEHVKDLIGVHIDNIGCSSLINNCSHSIIEGDQIRENLFALGKVVVEILASIFQAFKGCFHKETSLLTVFTVKVEIMHL